MEVNQSLNLLIFALPVYQILFYTVQVITFNRKKYPKWLLGFLFLGITLFFLTNGAIFLGLSDVQYIYLFLLAPSLLLTFFPLYFKYLKAISTIDGDVSSARNLLIFAPSILVLLFCITTCVLLPGEGVFAIAGIGFPIPGWTGSLQDIFSLFYFLIYAALIPVQAVLFVVSVFKLQKTFKRKEQSDPVSVSHIQYGWQLVMLVSVFTIVIFSAGLRLLVPVGEIYILVTYNLAMLVSAGLLGHFGIKQEVLYEQVRMVPVAGLNGEMHRFTDEAGNIIPENIDGELEEEDLRIAVKIEKSMVDDELFLRHDLSISGLSDHIGIGKRAISDAIRRVYGSNFYGLVNSYRVKRACALFDNEGYRQFTIESIATMSGFQSKSSFNACFKKHTGRTPSGYKSAVDKPG